MLSFLKNLFASSPSFTNEDLINGTVVDVRTAAEYQQGHFAGSTNIPLDQVPASLEELRQLPHPIITCCRSGNRSQSATNLLVKNGITAINGGTWNGIQAAAREFNKAR